MKWFKKLKNKDSSDNNDYQLNYENKISLEESKIKSFDLNIGKILENWNIEHALRELISNALDESIISKTKEIDIFKDLNDNWHIKDFGRGLKSDHLLQNENKEKKTNKNLIGRFGIGLKDSLATFERSGAKVTVESKYLFIPEIVMRPKNDFENLKTLSVLIEKPRNINFVGTEFIISKINDNDIKKAKSLFLCFNAKNVLDENNIGQIIEKSKDEEAAIYLNGMKISDEHNFLFSYNITSTDAKIEKSLNRERMNMGRSVYSDRIKKILLNSKAELVAELLAEEFKNILRGTACDEILWLDVQKQALKILSSTKKYIFITQDQMNSGKYASVLEEALGYGKKIIIITDALSYQINTLKLGTIDDFIEESNLNFEFQFIDKQKLSNQELLIFEQTNDILKLVGGIPEIVKEIKISQTMQKDDYSYQPCAGLWDIQNGWIIIKRSELSSIESYASVLIHESIHAKYNVSDSTREFENKLTDAIGIISKIALDNKKTNSW